MSRRIRDVDYGVGSCSPGGSIFPLKRPYSVRTHYRANEHRMRTSCEKTLESVKWERRPARDRLRSLPARGDVVKIDCLHCDARGDYSSVFSAVNDGWGLWEGGEWTCPECNGTDEEEEASPGYRWGWAEGEEYEIPDP